MTLVRPKSHFSYGKVRVAFRLHILTEFRMDMQGTVSAPTASEFIHRYRLPAPSSIKQAVSSLTEKEFLYHDSHRGSMVYDRFFGMWLRRLA